METYIRFMATLACGLAGMSMVLKVLLDGLFSEWDAAADLGEFMRNGWHSRGWATQRTEDVMLEMEKARSSSVYTRVYEQKRKELTEISVVETRAGYTASPIVLTPIPPPPADIVPS